MLILKYLVSLGVTLALFAVSDPLIGFCLYFCCYHSLNHCFRVLSRTKTTAGPLLFLASLFTVPVIPLWLWSGLNLSKGTLAQNSVMSCFVCLASLTFPHLFVVKKLHCDLEATRL